MHYNAIIKVYGLLSMILDEKLQGVLRNYEELGQKLLDFQSLSNSDFAKLSKKRSDMEELAELCRSYLSIKSSQNDLQGLIAHVDDLELREMAEVEHEANKEKLDELEKNIKIALLPKEEVDEKNAIIEIRAGTGGDEAALFAAVLFRMYHKYAEKNGWIFEIVSISETGLDGYKEASAFISGRGVFAKMKYESGVHRVQRVPETESSGRIHTSAATVAVLPEAEEVDVKIEDKDIRIDVFRASGAGGQHVNTTDSAVRITHIPTGIVVSQQDEKSQHKNKAKALKILRARIYEQERLMKDQERSSMRKGQVGSGDRSERIRTYNYPQSRITDHRINLTLYGFSSIVNEGELDPLINQLIQHRQAERLAENNMD
jgi:peptide chain release factor 1